MHCPGTYTTIKAIKVNLSETCSFIDLFLQMFCSAVLPLFTPSE